jgi:hypothetical protein
MVNRTEIPYQDQATWVVRMTLWTISLPCTHSIYIKGWLKFGKINKEGLKVHSRTSMGILFQRKTIRLRKEFLKISFCKERIGFEVSLIYHNSQVRLTMLSHYILHLIWRIQKWKEQERVGTSNTVGGGSCHQPCTNISWSRSPPQSLLKYLQITYMKFPE